MSQSMVQALGIYCFAINVLLYIVMGADKIKAKMQKRRVPEKLLFGMAILGGGLGGTLAMLSFRHKTRHWYFAVFFPLLAAIQLGLGIYLIF